ncbi:MAG: WD40 repeat domain-containing protein, partial [Pirellulaceae bacterium]|nr:WD40 repeat domain-containing protein [Pirellulaceae bacterium]
MALAYSPDGTTLASSSWDWTVRLWDPVSLRRQRVLTDHSPWHLAFSPDGRLLAGGSRFESISPLWNVQTGERMTTLPAAVTGLAFAPDGKALFAAGADSAWSWEIPSATQRARFNQSGWLLGLSPDGQTAVTLDGSKGGEIRFWDTASGSLHSTISVTGNIWGAALSSDGRQVAVGVGSNVKVWDTATRSLRSEFSPNSIARALAFSRDGKRLAAGLEDRRAVILDLATGKQLDQFVHRDVVWAVAFSPDGQTLAAGTLGGAIKLWDTAPFDETTTVPIAQLQCGQFNPDGNTFFVGNGALTRIIDVATGKDVALLPVSNVLAISGDASRLVARTSKDNYLVWDVPSGGKAADITFP